MIELRFHEELYDGFAIDEAVKTFEGHATFELVREPPGYVVRVTGNREELVADELANYALGKTIEKRGAA